MSEKQRCIIYTRFSPRPNAKESESCEFQEAECRKYADARLWEIKSIFEDRAISGADEERPGLFGALEELDRNDALLIYKPDRLARDVYLSELFRRSVAKQGAKIVCVSGDVEGEGPEQTMIRQVVASLAEYERKLIAARTKAAMRWRQSRGERMSRHAPYGMQIETDPRDPEKKILIPNEPEASAVEFIRAKCREGWKMSEITKHLNESYFRTFARSEKGWNQKTVTKIAEAP